MIPEIIPKRLPFWRSFLKKEGPPDYMLPNYFIELDSLPRTPNDKADKKALPLPEISSFENKELPQTPTEKLA